MLEEKEKFTTLVGIRNQSYSPMRHKDPKDLPESFWIRSFFEMCVIEGIFYTSCLMGICVLSFRAPVSGPCMYLVCP